jgi:hypothetical protein
MRLRYRMKPRAQETHEKESLRLRYRIKARAQEIDGF